MAKQRIGILGGTFDPIHRGHIQMGRSVLDAGYVDSLLMVPTGHPPYKNCTADAEDRWKMTVAACACDPRLLPSRVEIDRTGSIYAFDTLTLLHRQNPGAKLYYVIGTDALLTLHAWHRWQDILRLCTFLVCPRQDDSSGAAAAESEIRSLTKLGGRFKTVRMERFPYSSSEIRRALSGGEIPDSLDISTREYCSCKGLYGMPGRLDHIDEWIDRLFGTLKPGRFAHSLSVALTAAGLARKHGIDPLRAEQAGLLHDCAKYYPLPEMRRIALANRLTDDESILSSGALLHSVVGSQVAREQYGMNDPEVLEAIAYHNTGHAGMSRLAMCVCLADSIEPLRKDYPHLEEIRSLADVSLERALLMSLECTAGFVRSMGKYLHPRTQDTISWLRAMTGSDH